MLLRHIPRVGFGFNDLKVMISMLMKKNCIEDQKDSKIINGKTYHKKTQLKLSKNFSDSLAVAESTVFERLHTMRRYSRRENCYHSRLHDARFAKDTLMQLE